LIKFSFFEKITATQITPLAINNHYPFGMVKEGMFAKSGNGYRYGFNGMERDNETKGFGNDLSTFFRGYDPRLGRWKSVDPVTKAMESAYVGFANNPVLYVDPRGDDWYKHQRTRRLGYFSGFSAPYFKDIFGGSWFRFQCDVASTPILSFWEGVSDGSRQWASDAANYIVDRYNNPGHFFDGDIPNTVTGLYESAKFVGELAIGDREAEAKLYRSVAQTYLDFKAKSSYEWGVSAGYVLPEVAIAAATAGINAHANSLRGLNWIGRGGGFYNPAKVVTRGLKEAKPDGKFYSVAFEMQLKPTSYPGTDYMQFKEANMALNNAMKSNPLLSKLGISVPKSNTGTILGKSPTNWVWHHDIKVGTMQLVPKSQHPTPPGGIFWKTLHPYGKGGNAIWGK
jgi:RHS repeat-associated protein